MSDEKPQNPNRPRKQKAESGKAKAEDSKAESGKPKAISVRGAAARFKNKPAAEQSQDVPKSKIRNPNSEIQSRDVPKSEIRNPNSEIQARDIPKSEIRNPNSEIQARDVPKSEIRNPNSAIQVKTPEINMEVHHHPQLDHKPKPIKEYLLEGLMIFIAVMMGFIAENIREDITNREHAHQLVTQLVQDLKADTANLNFIYEGENRILKDNNALFAMLQQPIATVDAKKMLKLTTNSLSMYPFHPTGGAMGAIKAELHLKQFSNSKMIAYFANYEAHIEILHTTQDITLQYQRSYLEPFLIQHLPPSGIDSSINRREIPDTQLRNLSQNDFTEEATRMVLIKTITYQLLEYNRKLKNDAADMLKYIKKEYGVE
jgi:hypothetical protein